MSKLILALLTGMLITFIVDFFLFLGVKLNYFDFYEINIFYNVLFADNQNFLLFFGSSIVFGFILIFISNNKLTVALIIALTIIAIAPLFSNIGESLGKMMFMKKDVTYNEIKHSFHGDVYYDGRRTIHFYDNELQRIIILQKKDLMRWNTYLQ